MSQEVELERRKAAYALSGTLAQLMVLISGGGLVTTATLLGSGAITSYKLAGQGAGFLFAALVFALTYLHVIVSKAGSGFSPHRKALAVENYCFMVYIVVLAIGLNFVASASAPKAARGTPPRAATPAQQTSIPHP